MSKIFRAEKAFSAATEERRAERDRYAQCLGDLLPHAGIERFFGRAADDQAAPAVSFNQLARLFDQCVDFALGIVK